MTPREYHLKGCFRTLIENVGGLEAAAQFCRVKTTTLQTYYSDKHPTVFPPLDVIVALEPLARDRSDWPPITGALCRLLDGAFVARPDVRASGADLLSLLAKHAQESADVSRAICAAVADQNLCGAGAGRIRKEIAEAMELLALMDAELAVIEGDVR